MIRGVAYARLTLRWAVGAAVLLAATAAAAAAARHSGRQAAERLRQQIAGLDHEVAVRAEFGRPALQALRARARELRSALGRQAAWDRLDARLTPHWRREPSAPTREASNSLQRERFVFEHPAADDWPEIVATVRDVEALPGLAVEAIHLVAAAERGGRAFELVQLEVVGRLAVGADAPISHE